MKNIYILFLTALVFCSCEKDQIKQYDLDRYVYFGVKERKDTTVSFSHYPGKDRLTLRFGVEMTGDIPTQNMSFKLEVDPEKTTATAETYEVNPEPVFRKGMSKDTVEVTIKNPNDALKDKSVTLVLTIGKSEFFQPGFVANRTLTIKYDNKASKPLWWNATVTIYLGAYSPNKFRDFVDYTKVTSLEGLDEPTIQNLARQFKKYAEEQNLGYTDINA